MTRWRRAALAALCVLSAATGHAQSGSAGGSGDSSRFCDAPPSLSVAQQDRLLRFAAAIKDELDRSGEPVALVARTGLDLERFGIRYTHAGISLRDSPELPWAVRQLYFACDEGRPRIFDQGVTGFALGTHDPARGHVSLVFLPPAEAAALARAALDKRRALSLLGGTYSANAYAFGLRYQNCNQWVAEMLAGAWGAPEAGDAGGNEDGLRRAAAQAWLREAGYEPGTVTLGGRPWLWLAALIPWLHHDDHPAEWLDQATYRVSLPASIEAFVQARLPQARRVQVCHTERQIVVRQGWAPLPARCEAGPGDRVIPLVEPPSSATAG